MAPSVTSRLPLRTIYLVATLALAWAIGPWAIVLGVVLAVAVPVLRRNLRPRWRPSLVFVVAVAAAGVVAFQVPEGVLPMPSAGGNLVTPPYVGAPATAAPISLDVPQHPQLAANGDSSMHNDGWASDAYPGPGPLGVDPQLSSAWYGVKECATIAFDSRGRMIALCGAISGPVLHVMDADTMRPLETMYLPGRSGASDRKPWEDLCGGAYFYLDKDDLAYVATTERTIEVVSTSDVAGEPLLTTEHTIDLTGVIPANDCVIGLMPDWQGRATWWISRDGRVGLAGLDDVPTVVELDERVANTISVDEDGMYVVTVEALYKFEVGEAGVPDQLWRAEYENGGTEKPGQISAGSGSTPTILPSGLVAFTDNAEPRMNVVFVDAETGVEACRAGVFGEGESATENSLVAVAESAVVVENNYGYDHPLSTVGGRGFPGGFARVDAVPSGDGYVCEVAWTNQIDAPSTVPKLSLETGLIYTYRIRPTWWGMQTWYVTAMDATSGDEVFSVRAGTGMAYNNHGAPVTLAPDGTLYVPTMTGMLALRDGE
jgi:hypothetical protein